MRSLAFSCFAGLSSCLASEWYSSMVFWKEVRDAETEPSAAGLSAFLGPPAGDCESVGVVRGCEVSVARSLRMAVLCLRALLKVVFWCGCQD